MRRWLTVLGVGLALTLGASAASAATPGQIALAKRYIDDTHLADTMRSMLAQMRPMLLAQSGTELSPEDGRKFDLAMDAAFKRFLDGYLDRCSVVIADIFTETELNELVIFYESPTGRSLIAKSPELQSKIIPLVSEMMPDFQADFRKELCSQFAVTCDGTSERKHS